MLGRLERVELREIWKTEASGFTPWLAQEENLQVLSDAVEMNLELEAQERNVGPFRADILCRDMDDESWVLIENQLERTDHTHLGQLMTYAAGLDAVTIVWIAARFTDEHRAALDWLNEISDERIRFFGLEVELWCIGGSQAAPRFNVISKPNDWSKTVSSAKRQIEANELSETSRQQLKYWTNFKEVLENLPQIQARKPRPRHYMNFSIGRSGFRLATVANWMAGWIRAELYIEEKRSDQFFQSLLEQKTEIETEYGSALNWDPLDHRHATRISLIKNADPANEADWPQQHEWLRRNLEKMNSVFRQRIRALDVSGSE